MATILYLVRNAATVWSSERRVTGQRDISLSTDGKKQAEGLAVTFAGQDLSELASSPAPRAVETAAKIAESAGVEVTRDPRLIDFAFGALEGRSYTEDSVKRELETAFAAQLRSVRDRMLSSVSQLLVDNELGSHVVLVSHAGPLRVLLAHYLGVSPDDVERVRLEAGHMAVLAFDNDRTPPRLLAMNITKYVHT